jgi:transcriptional regulator with XRE-family HTH domain
MTDRIQTILSSLNLSPSQLADQISVQRSSLSHILSGRNKPSLDFVTKVLTSYPQIDPDWLLFGKGSMLRRQESPADGSNAAVEKEPEGKNETALPTERTKTKEHAVKEINPNTPSAEGSAIHPSKREPGQIVLLYDDNTYRIFTPS